MKLKNIIGNILLLALLNLSCENPASTEIKDSFDRGVMLENWLDHYIKPGYSDFLENTNNLALQHSEFQANPTTTNLTLLRESYKNSYSNWQTISIFGIGPAERLDLRGFVNTYPTDPEKIEGHIDDRDVNLVLPSTRNAQGFPALDYLLYKNTNDEELIAELSSDPTSIYLTKLISRLQLLASQVHDHWNVEQRETFITNPESVDRLVNDFLLYYEKYLRAGKLGIPSGVFSGAPLPNHVEAPYSGYLSKSLLIDALIATQSFFNADQGLKDYLEWMEKSSISDRINTHWDAGFKLLTAIDDDLRMQIETDHLKVLKVYDELQKALILLKVDMLQVLSIQVDYVDADGD